MAGSLTTETLHKNLLPKERIHNLYASFLIHGTVKDFIINQETRLSLFEEELTVRNDPSQCIVIQNIFPKWHALVLEAGR